MLDGLLHILWKVFAGPAENIGIEWGMKELDVSRCGVYHDNRRIYYSLPRFIISITRSGERDKNVEKINSWSKKKSTKRK